MTAPTALCGNPTDRVDDRLTVVTQAIVKYLRRTAQKTGARFAHINARLAALEVTAPTERLKILESRLQSLEELEGRRQDAERREARRG